MGKIVKKIHKFHDPLDLDNKLLDPMGLPSLAGKENGLMPDEEKVGSTVLPAVADAPTAVDPAVLDARDDQRKRQLASAGLSGNVLTRPGGLSSKANTQTKSLLGS